MTGCSYCRLRANSKVPNGILDRCVKHSRRSCRACERLVEINRKIEEAHLALEKLLEERENLAATLNAHHDPIAQNLPPEIVSRVFLHTLPFQPSLRVFDDHFDEKQHVAALFRLGGICRSWRNVAYGTPLLWTVLSLSLTDHNCVSTVQMSQEWLKRTGASPLYVRLHVDQALESIANHSGGRIVKELMLHCERYEVMELDAVADFVLSTKALLTQGNFSSLKYLRFLNNEDDVPYRLHLNMAPTVIKATPSYYELLSINWSRLTSFSLKNDLYFYIDECVDLFLNAPHLSFCSLALPGTDSEYTQLNARQQAVCPVKHLSLKTLEFQSCLPGFWDYFQFPNLKTLRIGQIDRNDDGTRFRRSQERCGCSLTTLDLGSKYASEATCTAAMEMIRAAPHLQCLTIRAALLKTSVFTQVNTEVDYSASSPPFLHQLTSLKCYSTPGLKDWSSLLIFLITMTSGRNRSLKAFKIYIEGRLREENYEKLAKVLKFEQLMVVVRGLDFRVTDAAGADLVDKLQGASWYLGSSA